MFSPLRSPSLQSSRWHSPCVIVAVLACASPALSASFVYLCPDMQACPVDDEAGKLVSSELRFNSANNHLQWLATYAPKNGITPTVLWLVVSHGPDPEATVDEHAILYADRATGLVTVYEYDKASGMDSWRDPGILIESCATCLAWRSNPNGSVTFNLMIDATSINAFTGGPHWVGLQFGQNVGFWAAGLGCGAALTHDPSGAITNLKFSDACRSSYDRNDRATREEVLAVRPMQWGAVKALLRD